jgi:Xaa-Pro aminopeptidase
MLDPATFTNRRRALLERVGRPILLLGNGVRARNLPMTSLPFRQDSTFLYFTGCALPDAALLLDDEGATLFLPEPDADDELWHGPSVPRDALQRALHVDRIERPERLARRLADRAVASLAVPDEERNRWLTVQLGRPFRFGSAPGDDDLIDAVIAMRRTKSSGELDEMRAAAAVTARAFRAVMGASRPGATERGLAAVFEGVLAAAGCTPGYAPILTVRGEVLHNHDHSGTLREGDLLLLDGGGEVSSGYGVDVTRTWPVSGRPDPRQRAVYDAVLESQRAAIAACRAGVRYREVHDVASRVLATFLRGEGLLRCSVDEALDTGAHGVFYPHGTGHHLGLDVHDLENFGDRPSYPPGGARPRQFGTRNLRLDLPLESGWVVTVEPGIYFVPAILRDPTLRAELGDRVDWDRASSWIGFGGIRIEDDVAITAGTPDVLTAEIPKAIDDLAAIVGLGRTVEERLC